MKHNIFIASTNPGAGLTSVSLGLYRILEQAGINIGFCKPIIQSIDDLETSVKYFSNKSDLPITNFVDLNYAKSLLGSGKQNELLEKIIEIYHKSKNEHDVVLIEGLINDEFTPFANKLNADIAKALDAEIILVCNDDNLNYKELNNKISMSMRPYGGINNKKILGLILNKMNAKNPEKKLIIDSNSENTCTNEKSKAEVVSKCNIFKKTNLLGFIPWKQYLNSPRVIDIANYINAKFINKGESEIRRVDSVQICAATLDNFSQFLAPNILLICPGDRDDVILAACLSAINGTPLAGILITGNIQPKQSVLDLGSLALKSGLPIMIVPEYTYNATNMLNKFDSSIKADDTEKLEEIMNYMAECIDIKTIKSRIKIDYKPRLSPPAFRYSLLQKTKSNPKKIVLPEGEEPRIIQAAISCQEQGIANCILLGRVDEIEHTINALGLKKPNGLQIVDPELVKNDYVEKMIELRKHKGMNEEIAKKQLEDPIVVGTMMLAAGDVDGLVAGAVNTTANTVRPALQLIKTKPNSNVVSSIFFMCLPDQVIVYGDCAINPDPNAEQLADIAIQSHDSAKAFNIDPLVAMLSYSTGASGSGQDVEKVIEATKIVKDKRPDIIIDGPLQYDAATVESVAKKKAPNSTVAGNATVCIFPDLNTGNTTYKAVQRSANVISIGPMLQGLRKPVNDLSRGALVEDIVYTIALTVIQAQ